jgi:hypothetical protein
MDRAVLAQLRPAEQLWSAQLNNYGLIWEAQVQRRRNRRMQGARGGAGPLRDARGVQQRAAACISEHRRPLADLGVPERP